jgi:deoxyribonuclease-4
MADRPRFGPAGVPPAFHLLKATLADVPQFLREIGLDALEYEAVRWGKTPQIQQQDAQTLGQKAKQHDVWLSLHASYYINLSGNKTIREASKQRLIACTTAAEWMQAHTVIFHPGFYANRTHEEAYNTCLQTLKEIQETLNTLNIKAVKLGPETMGRTQQLGALSEILDLCETLPQIQPVIDWSHIHAREIGKLRTADDYLDIITQIENRLGTQAVKNLHCHFTKIEYTTKGEKRHHTLDEKTYGPDFRPLAKIIAEQNLKPVIISESPLIDIDALKMRDTLQEEMKQNLKTR